MSAVAAPARTADAAESRSNLSRLVSPRSVAVVGGGTWCADVVEQCRRIGFDGPVWPVHPHRQEVGGAPAYPSVEALPGVPDAAFVGVNREAAPAVVRALAARGTGGAVCFASGFREADGAALERELVEAAGAMRLLGPNCYGFLNLVDGAALWPDQHGAERVERGVAILTHSSNVAINLSMQRRGLPLAFVATLGNAAQTGAAELGQTLLADARITALGLHLEGPGDLEALQSLAAAAREAGKGVLVLKTGRSEAGREAAVSHTAALAGGDEAAGALLDRLGFGRVGSLGALLEALAVLHGAGPLARPNVASMSCSGGEAGLMADAGTAAGLSFPPLVPKQREALGAALGPRVALANPLDYHTYCWGDVDTMAAAFTAMTAGPDVALGIVVLDLPRADRCRQDAWEPAIIAAARARKATNKPVAVLSTLPEGMPEAVAKRLAAEGLVPLASLPDALDAVAAAARIGSAYARAAPLPLLLATPRPGPAVSEAEAKALLAEHGLQVPEGARAQGAAEAAEAAVRLGFPVVLKAEGHAHKSEHGAVALNLADAAAVREAAETMEGDAFLVERMVGDAVAELLVGIVHDPACGAALTIAPGGVLAELMQDRATLMVPVPREAVESALRSLGVFRLLEGYRGRPEADIEAVLDAVMVVQRAFEALRPREIEINPLICTPGGAVAADALIVRPREENP